MFKKLISSIIINEILHSRNFFAKIMLATPPFCIRLIVDFLGAQADLTFCPNIRILFSRRTKLYGALRAPIIFKKPRPYRYVASY